MKAIRLTLTRTLFEAAMWTLGSLAEGGVLFLKGGDTVVFFRCNGRAEIRKGIRLE